MTSLTANISEKASKVQEGKKKKGKSLVRSNSIPALTGKETDQDLIGRFNEYYKRHKNDRAADSLSTIAATPSQLMKNRECRMVSMRRILVLCSLCLWTCTLIYVILWFMIFYVWPLHFSRDLSPDLSQKEGFSLTGRYSVLLLTFLHTYIVGTWGIVAAFCGQDKCLKRYMLTAPWFLFLSLFYPAIAISFVSSLSQKTIAKSMHRHLGLYRLSGQDFSRAAWDVTQIFLRCCGVDSPNDWLLASEKLELKYPESCCKNELGRRERNKERLAICVKDNTLRYVFPKGCKEITFGFYTNVGAGITALGLTVTLLIIFSVIVAMRFYVVRKKYRHGQFRYKSVDYFLDFLCIRRILSAYRKYKNKKSNSRKSLTKTNSKDSSATAKDKDEPNSTTNVVELDKKVPEVEVLYENHLPQGETNDASSNV